MIGYRGFSTNLNESKTLPRLAPWLVGSLEPTNQNVERSNVSTLNKLVLSPQNYAGRRVKKLYLLK